MKIKNLTSEQIEEIKSLYLSKTTLKVIAKQYNCCETTISKLLKEEGITPTKKGYKSWCSFSKEKELEIIKLYCAGYNQTEIATKFNTFNTSIRRVLLRYNIPIRSGSKINRLCKHNPFKKNDEYSDYFLGLLLTDGTISSREGRTDCITLSLSEQDSYIVEQFRDWASPKSKISKIFQKLNSSYMYSASITNKETVEWLRRKGNFYNKSYECKIYCPINWNILRGIFDGDGGFHKTGNSLQFFICGLSKCFIYQIHSFLQKNGINSKVRFSSPDKWHKNGLYYVEVYKQSDVIKLGLNMYSNAHIFIKRKYERWLTFYESRKDKYSLNSGKEMAI